MCAGVPQEASQVGIAGHQWCCDRCGAVIECEHPSSASRMDLQSHSWEGLGHWSKGRGRGGKSLRFFFYLFPAFYLKKPKKTLKNVSQSHRGKTVEGERSHIFEIPQKMLMTLREGKKNPTNSFPQHIIN